jgi:hypothetical protein
LLCAAAVLCGAPASLAAPRVAIIHGSEVEADIVQRLRAELDTLGLEVAVSRMQTATAGTDTHLAAACALGTDAAIRIAFERRQVALWVADCRVPKVVLDERLARDDAADDVAALRVVELVRATVIELRLPGVHADGAASQSQEPATPARPAARSRPVEREHRSARPPKPPREGRLSAALGPAVELSLPDRPALPLVWIGVGYRATSSMKLDAWLSVSPTTAELSQPEGSADVRPVTIALQASFAPRAEAWSPELGLGVAAQHILVQGRADAPYQARSDPITVALPFARAALVRRLTPRFGVGAHGWCGYAIPRPVVRFVGREAFEMQRPALGIGILLALTLD